MQDSGRFGISFLLNFHPEVIVIKNKNGMGLKGKRVKIKKTKGP
jgi:hypothetical protein